MFGSIPVVDGRPAYDIREPEVENNHGGRVDGRVGKTGVTGRGGTDLMAKGTLSDAAWRQQCGVSPSLTRTVAISVLLGQVCNSEGEAESGAASGDVIDPDPLAVRVEEGLGDRQSQVGAGVGFAAKEEADDLYSRSGRAGLDEQCGQLKQPPDLQPPFARLGTGKIHSGNCSGHREHDGGVDDQCYPVLGGPKLESRAPAPWSPG